MTENGKQEAEDRKPTQRVVLERVRVLVLPDGFDVAKLRGSQKDAEEALATLAKGGSKTRALVGEAWRECGEFTGSKKGAIEGYAGKPGTPDAKVGTFKAPTVTAMKGGLKLSAPPQPLVQAEAID